jgi:uncharacterized protein
MDKKIAVISAGIVHPNLMCRFKLKQLLKNRQKSQVTFSAELSSLDSLSRNDTSVVILYFQKKQISEDLLDALEQFVFNGGGLLALHSASASFKQNKRYFNLIGGRFIHHGKIDSFQVDAQPGEIYKNIPGFTIKDELYLHEVQKDVTVHFSTDVNNKAEPVVWTRELGKGKTAYCSLGHGSSVLKHPQVQSIIYQSLDWLEDS